MRYYAYKTFQLALGIVAAAAIRPDFIPSGVGLLPDKPVTGVVIKIVAFLVVVGVLQIFAPKQEPG